MNWPLFVYRLADYFDRSPFIKASLVCVVFAHIISGAISLAILIMALFVG